jgi:hypothetical protein
LHRTLVRYLALSALAFACGNECPVQDAAAPDSVREPDSRIDTCSASSAIPCICPVDHKACVTASARDACVVDNLGC